jgi:hypothetical protein
MSTLTIAQASCADDYDPTTAGTAKGIRALDPSGRTRRRAIGRSTPP